MIKKVLLGLTTLTLASSLSADIKPMIGVGIDGGGDNIARATVSGDDQEIKAGAGLSFEGGVAIKTPSIGNKLVTQLLVGYKTDSIDASNGDLEMSRVYINAIESYNFGNVSVGAGITYHITPKFSSSGAGSNAGNADFDSAVGGIAQATYNFNQHSSLGLRATAIKYDVSKTNQSFDANSAGLYF
ncbi:MAG: hypothetical protein V3V19_08410, partial [Cocleimonas sp.]